MDNRNLVEEFCTPPRLEESDFDLKAFDDTEKIDIEFEGRVLKGYSIGKGPDILLVHGWGSRASHMSLLARYIAKSGYHVLLFDGPAHGRSCKNDENDTTNMLEFGRAVSHIARNMNNLYAVIGHSFGATVSAFTMAGTLYFSRYSFFAEKLILISAPSGMFRIIEHFCRNRNQMDIMNQLTQALEQTFNFKTADYNLTSALPNFNAQLLIIHDEEDEDIPISDALKIKDAYKSSEIFITKGFGHRKILMNRGMLKAAKEFLMR